MHILYTHIYSYSQHTFIKFLLHTRHYSRTWRFNSEDNRQKPLFLPELIFNWGETNHKQDK